MSWEREPLFTKAKLYFEKAYDEDKEGPHFGLWCAMGLELLARSAIAKVSPTLLAEPDREHQNLLHALNLGSVKIRKKSIAMAQVLNLCQILITDFTESEFKMALAIVNQRNEELHTGSVAFSEYPTQKWIAGFYRCCKILCEFQEESLNSLLGDELQREADVVLNRTEAEVINRTKSSIAAHGKVFEDKSEEIKEHLREDAEKNSERLASRGHHRVNCPACKCRATVLGEPYGKENVVSEDDKVVVRQSILPTMFNCTACELSLNGYSSLLAAEIANHYTRRIIYTPEEYYNMISYEEHDAIVREYQENDDYEDYAHYEEWNNE